MLLKRIRAESLPAALARVREECGEDALLFGSPAEVADRLKVFADQGYTDVIVRNLSARQDESLATIERLAEVKALLRN